MGPDVEMRVGMYELFHPPWGGYIVFWMEQISKNDISENTPISMKV